MSRPAGAKLIVTRSADEKNHRSSKLKPDSNTVDLNWLWRSLLPCTRERRATLGTKLYKHWACFHLPDSEASPTLISMVPFCFSKLISLQGCFHSCMLYSTIFFFILSAASPLWCLVLCTPPNLRERTWWLCIQVILVTKSGHIPSDSRLNLVV